MSDVVEEAKVLILKNNAYLGLQLRAGEKIAPKLRTSLEHWSECVDVESALRKTDITESCKYEFSF